MNVQSSGSFAAADAGEKGHDIYLDQTEVEPPLDAQRKLVRRQDLGIVPLSAGIYLLCYLDRSNIGTYQNTRICASLTIRRKCKDAQLRQET